MNDTAFFENIVQNKRAALVIGGAGFLGSHVCGRLLDEGATVVELAQTQLCAIGPR
jgi:NAD(P)-dependent dehydrogenase (short-subunit alcohol dehydrogenase family)